MNPIVVAYGEHEHATSALRWAAELATVTGAGLRVVSVFEPSYAEMAPDWYESLVGERKRNVASVLEEIDFSTAESVVVKSEHPFEAVAAELRAHEGSLAVIGSQDKHRPGGLGAGHPGLALIHETHNPVAVVRPFYEPLEGGVIVVGVDGSPANSAALRFAERMAVAAKASIHAVFAYDPVDDTFVHPDGWHRHSDEVRREVAVLTAAPTKLYLAAGHPSQVLIEHAERERCSAIVVGTRGRGGFAGLRLGRVPAQLVEHATAPVIIVPHQ